jgi:hypothetical protein
MYGDVVIGYGKPIIGRCGGLCQHIRPLVRAHFVALSILFGTESVFGLKRKNGGRL